MVDLRTRLYGQAVPMPSGCLVWRPHDSNTYGVTTYKGKPVGVHRLAWELDNDPIPPGMTIDHVRARGCIYKRCINTAHLEVVTLAENVRRAVRQDARNLAAELRAAIESGEIPCRLPSLTTLTAQTGLSLTTVMTTWRILKDEGLIVARPGWGTFVRGCRCHNVGVQPKITGGFVIDVPARSTFIARQT